MWIGLLIISWVFGVAGCGIIFGNNCITPSLLTISIATLPIINFLFVVIKLIVDGIKNYKNGKTNDEIEKIKKLFQTNGRKD